MLLCNKASEYNLGRQHLCLTFKYNKMKKIYVIILTVFLNVVLFSCTPTSMQEDVPSATVDCCDEDGDIDPPPPPPPTGNEG